MIKYVKLRISARLLFTATVLLLPAQTWTIMRLIMKKSLTLLLLSSSLLSACGEFSYKRGATPRDLEMTKKTCQSAGSEAAIEKCLEDNGWVVQKLDALDNFELFATTSESDNRTGSTAETTPNTNKTKSNSVFIDAEKAEANPPAVEKPVVTPQKQAEVVQKNNTPVVETPKPAPTTDPLDTFKINSWWKIGAGRDPLEADIKSCVTKLGEAHQPDSKTQMMTRGLILCMKDKGWRALRAK